MRFSAWNTGERFEIEVDAVVIVLRAAVVLERQALQPFLRRVVARVARPVIAQPEHEIRHGHDRRARLERIVVAEENVRRDEAAVAPAHDAELRVVDVRQRREIVDGRQHVVDFLSAVVDLPIPLVAVAGAAAIVRREDHVAALHRLDDERIETRVPVAVHAAVHPHERGVLAISFVDRRKQIRRNLETVGRGSCT